MTLQELLEIKSILTNYLNSESCADVMADEEVKAALEVIEREIRLKTMDPRKCSLDHETMARECLEIGVDAVCPECDFHFKVIER